MQRIAKFITFVLHPLVLICPAVFLVILFTSRSYVDAFTWTFIALGFTLVVVGYILFGIKRGFFSNFDVSQRQQRIYLFPVIILVGLLFLAVLIIFRGPVALLFAMIYFVIAVGVLTLVNLRIKASIHVGSLTAVIVTALYYLDYAFLPFLLFIPVMAWARVVERRHTVHETIVGALLGCILAFMGIFVVQYFI